MSSSYLRIGSHTERFSDLEIALWAYELVREMERTEVLASFGSLGSWKEQIAYVPTGMMSLAFDEMSRADRELVISAIRAEPFRLTIPSGELEGFPVAEGTVWPAGDFDASRVHPAYRRISDFVLGYLDATG